MIARRALVLAGVATALAAVAGDQVAQRSEAQKRHFAKAHPCPANGSAVPSCPGYVIDHIWPLCAGGKDAPENMQWQTIADAKAKDDLERKLCAQEKPCKP
jgi:hypothetical protein